MPSNYEQFYVKKSNEYGVQTVMPGVDVIIRDVNTDTDLVTVQTDSNGLVAAGSVSVAAGSRIRFRVENEQGLAGSVTQVTT
ncbi:MAG TPA: hypothetical protein VIL74_20595 [Pyrinomonadaceae bacterium]|jgi:hypothetical protein